MKDNFAKLFYKLLKTLWKASLCVRITNSIYDFDNILVLYISQSRDVCQKIFNWFDKRFFLSRYDSWTSWLAGLICSGIGLKDRDFLSVPLTGPKVPDRLCVSLPGLGTLDSLSEKANTELSFFGCISFAEVFSLKSLNSCPFLTFFWFKVYIFRILLSFFNYFWNQSIFFMIFSSF